MKLGITSTAEAQLVVNLHDVMVSDRTISWSFWHSPRIASRIRVRFAGSFNAQIIDIPFTADSLSNFLSTTTQWISARFKQSLHCWMEERML
jgi:hypothetical protein